MHWTKSKTPCVWSGIWIRLGIGWLWLKEAANSAQQVAAPTMPGWHAEVCGWLWDRRCNFDMSKLFFTHVFTTFWTVKWCNQYATLQVSLQFFTILLWLSPFWCILYPVILHILVISCHLRRETSPRKIVCHATPSWWWSAVGSATRPTPRRPRPCLSPGTRRLHLPISCLHFYLSLNQHFPLYPLHFNTLIIAWWELVIAAIANSWIFSHPFAWGQYLAGCGALTRGVRIGLHRVLCVCEAPQMRQVWLWWFGNFGTHHAARDKWVHLKGATHEEVKGAINQTMKPSRVWG